MGAKLERVEWGYQIVEWHGSVLDEHERAENTFPRGSELDTDRLLESFNENKNVRAVKVRRKVIITDWEEVTDAE